MEHYAGLDVSLKETSLCIVDGAGKIIGETKVASEPEALVGYFSSLTIEVVRIGLEAGPLSQWLHAALTQAGYEVVLLETRHVKAALSAMTVKTDRRDARGIAQLLRMGWYRPVHCKSLPSQEVRAILTARKTLLGKLLDIELSMRGILRGFGLKIGTVTRKSFEIRVRELTEGQATLTAIMEGLLNARATLVAEMAKLHKKLLTIARADRVCVRLMTVPGVGALTALTFKTAVDDPTRIAKSRDVGPLFGLTPGRYQSGETDIIGKITKVGDVMVRTALFEAANVMLTRSVQGLGPGSRQAPRNQASDRRPGAQTRDHSASHLGRWQQVPVCERGGGRAGADHGEIARAIWGARSGTFAAKGTPADIVAI